MSRGVPKHQLQCSLHSHPVLLHIGEDKVIQVLVDLSYRKVEKVVVVVEQEEEKEKKEEIKNTVSVHIIITFQHTIYFVRDIFHGLVEIWF